MCFPVDISLTRTADSHYHQSVLLDQTSDTAMDVAARAALRTLTLPSTFRALVTGRERKSETYSRVAYRVERRDVVARFTPASGTRRTDVLAPPNPASVNPWAVDPVTLPAHSRTPCLCPTCRGEGKASCGTCRGGARVGCGSCGATGRVMGQRGPKNCPMCRGQSTVKCPACTRGRVDCFTCDAGGVVVAWLEIERGEQVHVHVHPRDGVASLHADATALEDFDRPSRAFRNQLVADSGWSAAAAVAQLELRPHLDAVRDRVIAQRVQRFESTVHEIRFATRWSEGIVRVAGTPPSVLADSRWAPLYHRVAGVAGAGALTLVAAMLFLGRYLGRAEWFAHHGNAGAIALLGLVASFAAALVVAGSWLPMQTRGIPRVAVPGLVALAGWTAMLVLWFVGGPAVASVDRALERGDVVAARQEANALLAVDSDDARLGGTVQQIEALEAEAIRTAHEAEDDAHLARVQAATSLVAAIAIVQEPWRTERLVPSAMSAVNDVAAAELDAALAANDEGALEELGRVLVQFESPLAQRAHARARLAKAAGCTAAKDLRCAAEALTSWKGADGDRVAVAAFDAFDDRRAALTTALRREIIGADVRAADLPKRLAALEQATDYARLYEAVADVPSPRTPTELAAELARVRGAIEVQRGKDEAKARKEEPAAAKREAGELRRQEAAERKRARASSRSNARSGWSGSERLMCCDGTRSPSCTVDRASYRGCCSHHGGVC